MIMLIRFLFVAIILSLSFVSCNNKNEDELTDWYDNIFTYEQINGDVMSSLMGTTWQIIDIKYYNAASGKEVDKNLISAKMTDLKRVAIEFTQDGIKDIYQHTGLIRYSYYSASLSDFVILANDGENIAIRSVKPEEYSPNIGVDCYGVAIMNCCSAEQCAQYKDIPPIMLDLSKISKIWRVTDEKEAIYNSDSKTLTTFSLNEDSQYANYVVFESNDMMVVYAQNRYNKNEYIKIRPRYFMILKHSEDSTSMVALYENEESSYIRYYTIESASAEDFTE